MLLRLITSRPGYCAIILLLLLLVRTDVGLSRLVTYTLPNELAKTHH